MRKRERKFLLFLKDLKEGRNDLEWIIKSEDLEIEDLIMKSEIRMKMTLQKSGDKVLITGSLIFRGEVTCAYCGERFLRDFSEDFVSCYVKGDEKRLPPNLDLDDEEIDRVYYGGDFINLEPLIRDTIILSLPIAPQCPRHQE
ncbi:MAG: DUF177 domain-containing protein [candidate division WOR-3 bacterium]